MGGGGAISNIKGCWSSVMGVCVCVGGGGAISNIKGCWSSVMGVCVCVCGGAISNIKGCWSSVMGGGCVWGGGGGGEMLSVTQCSSVLVTKRGKSSPKSKCQTMTQEHLVFVMNSLKF